MKQSCMRSHFLRMATCNGDGGFQFQLLGNYRLCYAFDRIPEFGFPKCAGSIQSLTRDYDGTPLAGSFVLDVGLYKDFNGLWQFKAGMDRANRLIRSTTHLLGSIQESRTLRRKYLELMKLFLTVSN